MDIFFENKVIKVWITTSKNSQKSDGPLLKGTGLRQCIGDIRAKVHEKWPILALWNLLSVGIPYEVLWVKFDNISFGGTWEN